MAQSAVVLVGNVVDGVTLYGPFADAAAAIEWAEVEVRDDEWNVAELVAP